MSFDGLERFSAEDMLNFASVFRGNLGRYAQFHQALTQNNVPFKHALGNGQTCSGEQLRDALCPLFVDP